MKLTSVTLSLGWMKVPLINELEKKNNDLMHKSSQIRRNISRKSNQL